MTDDQVDDQTQLIENIVEVESHTTTHIEAVGEHDPCGFGPGWNQVAVNRVVSMTRMDLYREITRLQELVNQQYRTNADLRETANQLATERGRLREEVGQERNRADQLIRVHERWKKDLTQAAHAYADDHDWCEEFDDFMEQHGLDRRSRRFMVELFVSGTVGVVFTAATEEAARDLAREGGDSEAEDRLAGALTRQLERGNLGVEVRGVRLAEEDED